jgi:hypothetical protein
MRSRLARSLALAFAVALFAAAPVMAGDNGEGLAGETTDKLVTFFSLGVVIFFAVLVVALSLLQAVRERRKHEREAAAMRHRIGW